MKIKKTWLVVFLAVFFAWQGTAFARVIAGRIGKVDTMKSIITVNYTAVSGANEELSVTVAAETGLLGINSIADLKAGDEVTVTLDQNAETGVWKTVSVSKAVTPASAPASEPVTTPAPSPAAPAN